MAAVLLLLLLGVVLSSGHEIYPGKCPEFTPMQQFNWDKFSGGVWYVTNKFDTKSACLTYEFKTDALGFKSIEQINQLPLAEKVGVDHDYKYVGKLFAPQESTPANMVVRFPLNVIGSASYVVVDTDYDTYGMVCTCQDVDLLLTYAHRISCSTLQRDPVETPEITSKLKDKVDPKYQHDFDHIKQDGCQYGKKRIWNIDLSKISGLGSDAEDKITGFFKNITNSVETSAASLPDLQQKIKDII